eukprot:2540480-Amphidinium_carterae.1
MTGTYVSNIPLALSIFLQPFQHGSSMATQVGVNTAINGGHQALRSRPQAPFQGHQGPLSALLTARSDSYFCTHPKKWKIGLQEHRDHLVLLCQSLAVQEAGQNAMARPQHPWMMALWQMPCMEPISFAALLSLPWWQPPSFLLSPPNLWASSKL